MDAMREREELVDVALGLAKPDVILHGGKLVNVNTREVYEATILIKGRRIAAVEGPDYPIPQGAAVIDASGSYLTPGFIDPHVHLESSAITLSQLARVIVPRGVTSIAEDPHEIVNVLGIKGYELFYEEAKNLPLNLMLRVPGRVPGTPDNRETSGGSISMQETHELLKREEAVCLAGDINPNLLLRKDREQFNKIDYTIGIKKTVSGQSPGLSGGALNAFIAAGPEDSHVSADTQEILDIIRHGMRAMITHRPALFGVKDYKPLAEAINHLKIDTRMLMFCSDDVQPQILIKNGFLDERIRLAIQYGVDPLTAIQMSTINVADFFRIDRDYGSVSPGKFADINILKDLRTLAIDKVLVHGKLVVDGGKLLEQPPMFDYPMWAKQTVHLPRKAAPQDFQVPAEQGQEEVTARVIFPGLVKQQVVEWLAVKDGIVLPDESRDILSMAVIERHRNTGATGKGFVKGMGIKDGAVASTVSHDAHNLFVIGSNYEDMALAVNRLAEIGGGLVAIKKGKVVSQIELPIAGLISEEPVEVVAQKFEEFTRIMKEELHCTIGVQPLYDLTFICLPNLPFLGLTDKGLIDSETMEIIDVLTEPA